VAVSYVLNSHTACPTVVRPRLIGWSLTPRPYRPPRCAARGGDRVFMELSKVQQRFDAVPGIIRGGLTVTEVREACGSSTGW